MGEPAPAEWSFTPRFVPPDRSEKIATGNYDAGDEKRWDRYSFGKVILQVRAVADPYAFDELSLYTQRALQMVAGLLLGRDVSAGEAALGLPPEFYAAEEYGDLDALIDVLDRLLGEAVHSSIEELAPIQTSVVEVGASRPAPFSRRVNALLETDAMQQLASCQQLGLISFIWPTATHTRIEHAIGTFATACEALRNLIEDPQSPIMLVLATPYVQSAFIAAALLHDVGHFPLAHDLEEAAPSAFHHESRSVHLIESSPISELLERPRRGTAVTSSSIRDRTGRADVDDGSGWGVRSADVAAVVTGQPRAGGVLTIWTTSLLHSVLSGALDVDKLDYLIRDSRRLHVAAGEGIDVPRVLSSLTVAVVDLPENEQIQVGSAVGVRLAVRSKGARPAELVGRVRSHMFGVVYWHHSYRAIKAMMHWMVWDALGAGGLEEDALRRAGEKLAKSLYDALAGGDPALLFDGSSMLPGFERMWDEAPRIPYREGAVLHFIAAHGEEDSDELAQLLDEKRWFHSILTVDHPDNVAVSGRDMAGESVWHWVSAMQTHASETWVLARYRWARVFQRRLVEALHDARPPLTAVVRRDEILARLAAASVRQLILIDTVEIRKSHDKPLYIVQSERANSRRELTTVRIPVRRSYDQNRLTADFVAANGAIRVFAHPDYFSFIERTLPRETISQILVDSMFEVNPSPTKARRARRQSWRTQ
jgi:HD superfamily phosphohydrolase